MLYTADFETTTNPKDCRVWAWGVCSIDENLNFQYGNTMDGFIDFLKGHIDDTFYFHNLKFDDAFIFSYLFTHNYKHVIDKKDLIVDTFTTLISDANQHYSIQIMFEEGCVTIFDSLKIIPFGIKQIAKSFNLPIHKLEIEYKGDRPIGYQLTELEIDYLKNDVEIAARALKTLFNEGLNKMTQGSNALSDYKKIVTSKKFNKWFPIPKYDADIRQSYKGGFTYCNPIFQGKDIEEGIVFDVNSLYPSVMYECPLPYGEGKSFEGKYVYDEVYNLYVQMITCQFELKEGHIPCIQLKNNPIFVGTEYLESSEDEEVTMCLTCVDLKLFFDHYEVYNITYHSGWKFKSTVGLFEDYIKKWNGVKVQATIDKNEGQRTMAKLMLNALYGKFALNPKVRSKIPYLKDGIVKYANGEEEIRDPIYIPMGSFITAWARNKTIRSAQKVYNRFLYADTDSLHLVGSEIPKELEVDKTKLGAWKHESTFARARFLRQKSYVEEIIVSEKEMEYMIKEEIKKKEDFYITNGHIVYLNVTCAGMQSRCYKNVTYDNFKLGNVFDGRLVTTHVEGGIVLLDDKYTLKE